MDPRPQYRMTQKEVMEYVARRTAAVIMSRLPRASSVPEPGDDTMCWHCGKHPFLCPNYVGEHDGREIAAALRSALEQEAEPVRDAAFHHAASRPRIPSRARA